MLPDIDENQKYEITCCFKGLLRATKHEVKVVSGHVGMGLCAKLWRVNFILKVIEFLNGFKPELQDQVVF